MKDLDRLIFLQPFANRFAECLRQMSHQPQSEQLEFIAFPLNELVESNVRYANWSRLTTLDPRLHDMLDNLETLKDVRNLIVHRSKTLTYEETMQMLNTLYEAGQYIDWQISQAIDILSER